MRARDGVSICLNRLNVQRRGRCQRDSGGQVRIARAGLQKSATDAAANALVFYLELAVTVVEPVFERLLMKRR